MTRFAPRIGRTHEAATFAMAQRARALRAAGQDVISLSIGEPDFATPPHVVAAAHEAALQGQTKYPPLAGTLALREAVVRKYARDQKLAFGLDEVCITNGGKQGIFNLVMALISADDEVIIPAPAWAGYIQVVQFAGGTPVFVHGTPATGFRLAPAALAAAITPRTRLLILNYPNNPSGAAMDAEELRGIAAVLRRHPDVLVLSDDIYEHLLFEGKYATLAAVAPDLADRIVTLTGVSKSYAMTGWRIGFAAGPAKIIKAMILVQGTATSGVSSIGQAAALAALNGPQDELAARADIYRRRRDAVCTALNLIQGIECHKPDGAFYVFPSIAGCLGKTSPRGFHIATDTDFTAALLDEALVAVVPGSAFAMSGHIRISTATADATLAKACNRIAGFCAALR